MSHASVKSNDPLRARNSPSTLVPTALIVRTACSLVCYAVDIVSTALSWAKVPLSLCIFAWIILQMASVIRVSMYQSICSLPLFALFMPCPEVSSPPIAITETQYGTTSPAVPDYHSWSPLDMEFLDRAFGVVLHHSIPHFNVMKAGVTSHELLPLVLVSKLPHAETLAHILDQLSDEASEASRELQKFQIQIVNVVDEVSIASEYAAYQRLRPCMSTIPALETGLSMSCQTEPWVDPIAITSAFMRTLVAAGGTHRSKLIRLRQHLMTIHELTARDDADLSRRRASLNFRWIPFLHWNDKLFQIDNDLSLIQAINQYRRHALAYIVGAMESLDALDIQMEEILQRAERLDLAGYMIPKEMQLKSIRTFLQRLQERLTEEVEKRAAIDHFSGRPST